MDAYSWQEIIFGVVLVGGLVYGAWRFIEPRLNKGGSGGVGGKSSGGKKHRN